MAESKNYDVVIVGGGPAGLTAAIYTVRRAFKTLVVTKDIGGQLSLTSSVENYPGFEFIGGPELTLKMKEQAAKQGAEFLFNEIVSLAKNEEGFLLATADKQTIQAKSVILAFGLTPRNLEVPGEKELTGKGVAYCATCDGPLYRGKNVVVVGGGNAALDAAEYLGNIAKQVYVLVRKDQFRGDQVLVDHVSKLPNVKVIFNGATKEIRGQGRVEDLVYFDKDQKEQSLKVDGVFVEIGHIANTAWLKGVLNLNEHNEIFISENNETSLPGVFAAGDLTQVVYKQAVISAGEGAKAALQACRYLQGAKVTTPDWGK